MIRIRSQGLLSARHRRTPLAILSMIVGAALAIAKRVARQINCAGRFFPAILEIIMAKSGARQFWTRLAIVLGIWMMLAVVLTGQAYLVVQTGQRAHDDLKGVQPAVALPELFSNVLVDCTLWALLTLFILWLTKRFPLGQGKWRRSVLVHLAASLGCDIVQTTLAAIAFEFIRVDIPKPTVTANVLVYFIVAKFNTNLFFYWATLAVCTMLNYYRQMRDRELRSSQLEARVI